MNILSKFWRQSAERGLPPDASILQDRIASMMDLMKNIRGHDFLLNPEMAIVLSGNYEVTITQETSGIDDREDVIGFVYLSELECYEEFKTMQNDETLRKGPLGPMTLNYLADQAARQLLSLINER